MADELNPLYLFKQTNVGTCGKRHAAQPVAAHQRRSVVNLLVVGVAAVVKRRRAVGRGPASQLDREVGTEAEVTQKIVRKALDTFPIDQPVRIRVNPQDLAVLSAYAEPGSTAMPGMPARDAVWLGDVRVLPGGCIVEGRERIVDGRVDTALERVYRRIAYKDS